MIENLEVAQLPTGDCLHKTCYIHMIEYYIAMQMN